MDDIGAQGHAEGVVARAVGFARHGQDGLLDLRAFDPAVAQELARIDLGEAANQDLLAFLPGRTALAGNHRQGEIEVRGDVRDPFQPRANGLEGVEEEDRSHGDRLPWRGPRAAGSYSNCAPKPVRISATFCSTCS